MFPCPTVTCCRDRARWLPGCQPSEAHQGVGPTLGRGIQTSCLGGPDAICEDSGRERMEVAAAQASAWWLFPREHQPSLRHHGSWAGRVRELMARERQRDTLQSRTDKDNCPAYSESPPTMHCHRLFLSGDLPSMQTLSHLSDPGKAQGAGPASAAGPIVWILQTLRGEGLRPKPPGRGPGPGWRRKSPC